MASTAIPQGVVNLFETTAAQGAVFDHADSPSDRYYGYLAELQDAQYRPDGPVTWFAQLEIVPYEWMQVTVPEGSGKLRSPLPSAPTTLLVFDEAPLDEVAKALGTSADEIAEGQWFVIELGRDGAARSAKRKRLDIDGDVDEVEAMGRPVKRARTAELQDRFRPQAYWDVEAVRRIMQGLQPREIGVMDVGQASCNLLYDDQGHPLAYVDVGLPMFFNFASMPPADGTGNVAIVNPGPCLANNPFGIVTHFHWDHYYMLGFAHNADQLQDRPWIMPQQNAGPLINGIIANINNRANGRVHVFPPLMGALTVNMITIVPCAPAGGIPAHDLNNSGLAVVVRIDIPNQFDALLPGDAAFQAIAGIYANPRLLWMVAAHHGSDRHWQAPPAPNAANQGRLAYSYGINGPVPGGQHCYGHPRPAAVRDYPLAGWGVNPNVESTAETGPNSGIAGRGNILMANNVIPPPCGVPNCPFHVFPKIML